MNSEEKIRQEQKLEFIRFAKTYFDSFGWSWTEESGQIKVKELIPGSPLFLLLPINSPHEPYPSKKELNELCHQFDGVLVISSEFSPKMKKHSFCYSQHTASGINFSYCKK